MAILKISSAMNNVKDIEDYLEKDDRDVRKSTFNLCNEDNWANEMINTKIEHDNTKGRQYYHIIQSFENQESHKNYNIDNIHEAGKVLAQQLEKEGYEVVVVTHNDKEHLHNHIIVNSVSFENGKKLRLLKKEEKALYELNDKICDKLELRTLTESKKIKDEKMREKGLQPISRKRDEIYHVERKTSEKEQLREKLQYVWKDKSILDSESFKLALQKQGIGIARVTEKTGITYIDLNTQKKYRAKGLGDFNREHVSELIDKNKYELEVRQQEQENIKSSLNSFTGSFRAAMEATNKRIEEEVKRKREEENKKPIDKVKKILAILEENPIELPSIASKINNSRGITINEFKEGLRDMVRETELTDKQIRIIGRIESRLKLGSIRRGRGR